MDWRPRAASFSNRRIDETGSLATRASPNAKAEWFKVRTMFPETFGVSPEQMRAWNRREAESWYERGLLSYRSNHWTEAAADFSKALELESDFFEAHFWSGQALHRLNQFEKAQASFYRVIELKPDFHVGYNNLAWYYATGPTNTRSPEKALPLALKAVELSKTNHNEMNTLGVVYYRLGP